MTATVDNMLALDLTSSYLESLGYAPLIAGDYIDWRFQVLDENGDAKDLTGAAIVFTIRSRESDSDALFQRTSASNVTLGVLGIEADNQASEDEDAGTGTGWFVVRFRPVDEEALAACAPSRLYDIRIEFAGGAVRTFARGRVEVLKPRSLGSEIP